MAEPRRQHELSWTYDGNGRPLRVANTSGGQLWKTWEYGDANDGGSMEKGRLIKAVRYNRPPVGDSVGIIETYRHENGTAGPSETKRQVWWFNRPGNDQWGPTFELTTDYDLLGNPTTMGYPKCIANTTAQGGEIPCDDAGDVPAPDATATYTYNEGLMRNASFSLGPGATYIYHHNLQLERTDFGNGVISLADRGTNGMVRPRRLRVGLSLDTVYWDSGFYAYL